MADQISGFLVVMKDDISEEDSIRLIDAFKMIKGVVDVRTISKEPLENRVAKSRLVDEIRKALLEKLSQI